MPSYYVSRHPARKRIVLQRTKGTVVRPIAYFNDEEYAREFMMWLDGIFGIEPSEEFHGWSLQHRDDGRGGR